MRAILLSDLIDEHLSSLASNGYARNSQRIAARTCRGFLAYVGNIQVRNVSARHVDAYFAARSASKCAPNTLNTDLVALRRLFDFAVARRYMGALDNPATHRRTLREQPKSRQLIPASKFGALLDACKHPRDRAFVALGLYLLLRASEIVELRIGDVDLDRGYVSARILKSAKADDMPISEELDAELRRWLTWYAQDAGPLDPTWRLVPAKESPAPMPGTPVVAHLRPTKAIHRPAEIVQRALVGIGVDVRESSGASKREGGHTLRRSSARAVFDRLVAEGYDGAGRVVQSLLHHSSFQTTEHYLGIELDRQKRDELLRGAPMFPVKDNIISLEVARGSA